MTRYALVALGAALGGMARYAVAGAVQARAGATFPLGTLAVNVLGCAAIGALAGPGFAVGLSEEARLLLVVGLLGGFTTFSAFGYETMSLVAGGRYGAAALSVAANVGLSLAAVAAGHWAARGGVGVSDGDAQAARSPRPRAA